MESLAPSTGKGKLDFRFADEEDANEIAALVNAAHESDEVGKGNDGFRTKPRIDLEKVAIKQLVVPLTFTAFYFVVMSLAQLRLELDNARDLKWLVLETPMPVRVGRRQSKSRAPPFGRHA